MLKILCITNKYNLNLNTLSKLIKKDDRTLWLGVNDLITLEINDLKTDDLKTKTIRVD